MKFLHTGDFHIGKTVNDFSMLEDQRYILEQIIKMAVEEKTDAVVIAGDIYDRAVPPAEAVVLLNDFLIELKNHNIPVIMISGNHDSPERIGFAEEILQKEGIYIGGMYQNGLKEVKFSDAFGDIRFILLPFVKAAAVGEKDNEAAVRKMLDEYISLHNIKGGKKEGSDKERFVLVTHYFVTSNGKEPELTESETTIHVGGLDNVDASHFAGFDYTALGHIHKSQKIGAGNVYYAGAPLSYSFSEAGMTKTVNIVELKNKGEVLISRRPLIPLHTMRKIRGKLEDLIKPEIVEAEDCQDYIQVSLTNEEELIDPIGTLRSVYPNVMQIVLTKNEDRGYKEYESKAMVQQKSIPELFAGFYRIVREAEPDEERMAVILEAAAEAEGEQET